MLRTRHCYLVFADASPQWNSNNGPVRCVSFVTLGGEKKTCSRGLSTYSVLVFTEARNGDKISSEIWRWWFSCSERLSHSSWYSQHSSKNTGGAPQSFAHWTRGYRNSNEYERQDQSSCVSDHSLKCSLENKTTSKWLVFFSTGHKISNYKKSTRERGNGDSELISNLSLGQLNRRHIYCT